MYIYRTSILPDVMLFAKMRRWGSRYDISSESARRPGYT